MLSKSVTINNKEYHFRITNASQCAIEEKIGPLLNSLDHVMEAKTFATIIWGALNPLQHEITLEKASNIVDEMVDDGVISGSESRVDFVIDLLQGAGFFSEQEVSEIKQSMTSAQEKAKKQIKEGKVIELKDKK